MNKHILKPIIGGILFGAILFFAAPFIFIVLLLKFIFTPFGMGRMMMYGRHFGGSMGFHPRMRLAMADKVRAMSEEEYTAFKEKMNQKFNGCH